MKLNKLMIELININKLKKNVINNSKIQNKCKKKYNKFKNQSNFEGDNTQLNIKIKEEEKKL